MPKATLTFDMSEEAHEFETAVKASAMSSAVHQMSQEIFRPARKHGYPNQQLQELITRLDALANKDAGITEDSYNTSPGGTELVGMLENMFWGIINEHGISHVIG